MNIAEIESNLQTLIKSYTKESFIYDLLLAYGTPKSSVTLLKKGTSNLSKVKGEILLKKKLLFKEVSADLLHGIIDGLTKGGDGLKHSPRFVIVTDYKTLLAVDTKTNDTLDIPMKDLPKHYDFFLPWSGMEKAQIVDENPADVKAAEKMAKLYDEIVKTNATKTDEEVHSLNVFLTRLLFCYFAEDSNIFADNQFTNAIEQHTQDNGSDLDDYIERLFDLLNIEKRDASLPEYLKAFPYVNGGLFRHKHHIPKFTAKSRRIMIEVGSLDWSAINPDIFGSMIQAVITPDHRGGLGMHYTSVPNIMKVIEPLFLDDLYEAFEKSKQSKIKLQNLHKRLTKLKIFDPACGSGNFLIIAYRELRRLEILIYRQIDALTKQRAFVFSEIKLSQFYGIELDDFAQEVAILSLWLAEHQMNLKFFKEFGRTSPALPLHDGGHIVHGNATRIDWEEVCPKEDGDEIYILGNPPYLGSRNQNKEQKEDMKYVFSKDYKSLDYIACWFFLGANYIRGINAKCAFVSTNSISQGEQVASTWPRVLMDDLEIYFAHQSFKWQNNAKANANVIVVIIGLSNISKNKKYILNQNIKHEVQNINSYLTDGNTIYVQRASKPLSKFPEMRYGNMPNDKGNLILSLDEKNTLINNSKNSMKFIKKFIGASDYIRGKQRYCLWISDSDLNEARETPEIKKRLEGVVAHREKSSEKSTRKKANTPNQFYFNSHEETDSILIPRHSSERREYIPIGFFDSSSVIADSAMAIYHATPWLFGIVTSRMHMVWMKTVAGRLKTDYRYSSALVYNTFPFPDITEQQKETIAEHVFHLLDEREKHSEKTLAQLYDPDKMPEGLKEAHHQLDLVIEQCYRKKLFESDEERLEYLFKLYEEMIESEKV